MHCIFRMIFNNGLIIWLLDVQVIFIIFIISNDVIIIINKSVPSYYFFIISQHKILFNIRIWKNLNVYKLSNSPGEKLISLPSPEAYLLIQSTNTNGLFYTGFRAALWKPNVFIFLSYSQLDSKYQLLHFLEITTALEHLMFLLARYMSSFYESSIFLLQCILLFLLRSKCSWYRRNSKPLQSKSFRFFPTLSVLS